MVRFGDRLDPLQQQLDEFIGQEIIFKGRGHDVNNQNKNMIRNLFCSFIEDPSRLPAYIRWRIGFPPPEEIGNWSAQDIKHNEIALRIVADHIASMTDRFAILELEKFAQAKDSESRLKKTY
jgi:dGTP triphosphohydrolase